MAAKSNTMLGRFIILMGLGLAVAGTCLIVTSASLFPWGLGLVLVGGFMAGWDRIFRHVFTFLF